MRALFRLLTSHDSLEMLAVLVALYVALILIAFGARALSVRMKGSR